MEGDTGAGCPSYRVAAILQGLEESGVVLTMLAKPRDQQRRFFSRSRAPVIRDRCSVETNTESFTTNRANRGVQISDDRYTSCYQVAHCSVRPTSPPVIVSEFPPQRRTPTYLDGNFQVGGSGSCDPREPYTRSIRYRHRSTPDKRSIDRVQSREAEVFAHSLRNYPSFPVLRNVTNEVLSQLQKSFHKRSGQSVNKTPSSELVETILRETQAKFTPVQNMATISSIRSRQKGRSKWKLPYMLVHDKTQDILENKRVDRPRTGRKEDETNARKHRRNDDAHCLHRRKRNSRPENVLETTYDYLKPSPPSWSYYGRRLDRNSRIDEIKKHVRSAIREKYNQRAAVFPMCSKVQRRYDEHKKHCSGAAIDPRMSNRHHKIASASRLYRFLRLLNGYLPPDTCSISKLSFSSEEQSTNTHARASQYVQKDAGCSCGSDHRPEIPCPCRPPLGYEEYSRYSIEEEIHAWLSEIPVRSNEDAEDKARRENMVKNLVSTLEKLLYDDDFEQNVINEVTECVNKMPLWNSGTKQTQEQFKKQLIENLLDKLIPKPVDQLSETIKKFLDTLKLKHEIDKKQLSKSIVDKLCSCPIPYSNDQNEFNLFISNIYKILDKLPIEVEGIRSEAVDKMAKNLANVVIDLLRDVVDASKSNERHSTSNIKHKSPHCSWMGPCKRADLRPFYNRKKTLQHECDSHTCDYKTKYNNKSQVCDCCPESKHKVDCVCEIEMEGVRYPCDCESDEKYFSQSIDEEIDNWLNEIPVPVNENEVDAVVRKHTSKHLAEMLKHLPHDSDFKKNAKDIIERWVNSVSMWQPDNELEKTKLKALLTESLLNRITAINRRPDKLKVIIKRFIGLVDFEDNNVNKRVFVDNLIERLKYLTVRPEDSDKFRDLLISEIGNAFKQVLPQISGSKSEYINTLAAKLAETIIDSQSYVDIYADETTSLKGDLVKNISDWLDEVIELSETPPNMKEARNIIDDLATKFADLQSVGTDTFSMKKIASEIKSALRKMNISTKAGDNVIEDIIDSITDIIYSKEKNKLEIANRQEVFKELIDWLKDKEEVDNLSQQEVYSVVKAIVNKIETASAEGHEDYQDIILENLAKSGIYIDPDSQLEGLVTKFKIFSAECQETAMKDKLQRSVNAVVEKLEISKDNKAYIKNKLNNDIIKNITKSSIATKKGIENLHEILLEKIDKVIEELHLSKNVKSQLEDVVNKNIEELMSAKSKDVVMQTLLKEINYIVSKEDIPDSEKKHLKCKLKHMLKDYLSLPFSNQVKGHILKNIDQIVNETSIDNIIKEPLINKLIHVTEEKIHELPIQTMKDYIKDKIVKEIDLTIDKALLKENVKYDLKQTLKYILDENLKKPFSADVKDAILDQFHETINDLLIPDITKDDLTKKVTNIVNQNLDKIPHQTEIDHTKEIIMHDIGDLIKDFSLQKGPASHLREGLKRLLAEYLDRPYSDDLKDKLIIAVNKLINDIPMDFDKKGELIFKVIDTINNHLDNLMNQSSEEFAKELILKDIMRLINKTSMSNTEKDIFIHKIENLLGDSFSCDQLVAIKNVLEDGIRKAIYESSIPPSEQNELVDKMIDIADKILDESFYDDRVREHLHGIYDLIEKELPLHGVHKDVLKNELKAAFDKYLEDPELLDLIEDEGLQQSFEQEQEGLKTFEKNIKDIMDIIEETSIPLNKKHILENKLKYLAFESSRPKNLKHILKEFYKTIEELSIPWQHKKKLKSKLGKIRQTNLSAEIDKLKNTLLKDVENAIDMESLGEEQKNYLKTKFSDFIALLHEPLSEKDEQNITDGLFRIIEHSALSRDQMRSLKDRIGNVVNNISTKVQDERDFKEKMMEYVAEVIDEAPIRHHLKKDLMSQLKKAIAENFNQPLTKDTKFKFLNDFKNIIDELPITDYQRESLKKGLNDILTRQLERLPISTDDARYLLLSDIHKILEDKSLSPKAKKTDLIDKLRKAILINTDKPVSDDIKSKIQQNILETIDKAIIPNEKKDELKEELNKAVTKNLTSASSISKPADDLSNTLVKNICNMIKEAPISHENKRFLKKKIEDNLSEKLKGPMNNDLEETVNNEMLNIINEVTMPLAQKKILKNFLSNTVSQILQEHQLKLHKDQIKDDVLRDTNLVIEKTNIPKERKKELKSKLKKFLDENFEKPLTADSLKIIKNGINDIIAEAPLMKEKKVEVRHNLAKILDNNVKPLILPSNSKTGSSIHPTKNPKRFLLNEIDSVLDSLAATIDDKVYIKQMLESVADEMSQQSPEEIKDIINIILDDTSIPKNKKAEVLDKLHNKIINNLNTQDTSNNQFSITNDGASERLDSVLNELQIPSAQKNYFKNKLEHLIQENLNESLSNDTMQMIKDNIHNIVAEMPISENKKKLFRNKLSDLVRFNKRQKSVRKPSADQQIMVSSYKKAPAYAYSSPVKADNLIRELETVLDQFQIPSEHKKNLKSDLKNFVQEALVAPLTSNTNEIIKRGISEIMDDVRIPRDKVNELKKKLLSTVSNYIKPIAETPSAQEIASENDFNTNLPQTSRRVDNYEKSYNTYDRPQAPSKFMDDSKNIKSQEIGLVIDSLPISADKRGKINEILTGKNKLQETINNASQQESSDREEYKKQLNLNRDMTGNVDNNIYLSPIKKNDAMRAVDAAFTQLQVPNEEKNVIKSKIKTAVNEIFETPLSGDTNQIIKDKINEIIVDSTTLSSNKKNILKDKLNEMVDTNITPLIESHLTEGSINTADIREASTSKRVKEKGIAMAPRTINEKILTPLNSVIDNLDTSQDVKVMLKDVIQKNTVKGNENALDSDTLRSAITKSIRDAPITREEKTEIMKKINNVINENINSTPATSTNEKIFNIKGTVLKEIDNDLDSAQIPLDAKISLKDKIKNKVVKYLETPQSVNKLEALEEDIDNIINEAPILESQKSQLSSSIRNKIYSNTEHLPVTDTLSYYIPSNTNTGNKTWTSYSNNKSQQEDSLPTGVLYDEDDEDAKDQTSVAMPLTKTPKDYTSKKKKLKENMLKDFGEVIDVINLPRKKKTDLKIKLNAITNPNIDKLFESPKENKSEIKRVIANKIDQVVEEVSAGAGLTKQMKSDLKDQLLKTATKNIDAVGLDKTSTNYTGMLSAIDRLPVPNHIKDELKNKIIRSSRESVSSTQEFYPLQGRGSVVSVIPEEGPVTSTPKKGRRSWEKPVASYSTIANEDVMQSLSPEERDYWIQIEVIIGQWLNELPVVLDEETKALLKREIANDITDRLQYLQFNPSAKKTLREELENLQYQVFRRLGKVLTREEMQLAIQGGDKLMTMMMDIKAPDEDAALKKSAELEFHQQIKDIISNTLPDLENASTESLHSFELMKEELADAFIKLHYTGGNEEELNKLKHKISDEIDKFCQDYLRNSPNKPIEREKLKYDLYNALKQVHPSDDLMKSVVEHVRLKDVVYEWLNKLPINKLTTTERVEIKKNIAIFAKKLLDLEQNEVQLTDSEVKNKMATLTVIFLKALPLKAGQEKNIDKFKNDLIDRVNETKMARAFDASTRHSITLEDFMGDEPWYPPCILSAEDLEHLARIKKRACMAPDCLATFMRKTNNKQDNKRNASVNPMSIEAGVQTEVCSENTGMSSTYGLKTNPGPALLTDQFSSMQFLSSPCTGSLSNMDVQPQIIVKEYYWNSTNSSELQNCESRMSGVQKRTYFATRPTPRCLQKYSQTCQDKALGSLQCTSSSCPPPPCASKYCNASNLPQHSTPCQRIRQQKSCLEKNRLKGNDQCTKYSETHINTSARKERLIELGSLDKLRKPSQKERRFEDYSSFIRSPEQTVWEKLHSNPDDCDEVEIKVNRGQTKDRTVLCKCKAKPVTTCMRGRWKQESRKDRTTCAGNDRVPVTRCLKGCSLECPYPSFMYFRQ